MKLVIAGVMAVLAAAGLTWFAAPRVLALTGSPTDPSWMSSLAFVAAGLALVGAVVMLTWPTRGRAAATALPPSAPVASDDPEAAVPEPAVPEPTVPEPAGSRLIFLVERESPINPGDS